MDSKPMISLSIENLGITGNFIFVVPRKDYDEYNYKTILRMLVPNCQIVIAESPTQGPACSVLLAKEYIDNDTPLM